MKTQCTGVRGSRTLALCALVVMLSSAAGMAGAAGTAEAASPGVVNVNTATAHELARLPGIGEARAEALIAARKRLGGFENLEDLLEVRGVGEAGLARLRPHVTLQGKTTLRPASADR